MCQESTESTIVFRILGGNGFLSLKTNNEWVQAAQALPWTRLEEMCGLDFARNSGADACAFRTALCALMLMARYGYNDEDLVAHLEMNPYYQYFIGMEAYAQTIDLNAERLKSLRKAVTTDMLALVRRSIRECASQAGG